MLSVEPVDAKPGRFDEEPLCGMSPPSVEERGSADSVARRDFALPVARLNICGMRARESEEEPSGGCMDWYVSNSEKRALRARRNSVAV